MSILIFHLEGNTGIGRVTQLQGRNQGQISCVMDQSFTHKLPHLPSPVHTSCSCLYFLPGRLQDLSPVSFAKTLPSQPYTWWLLLSLFRHLFIHMDWNLVWWRHRACCHGRDGDFILCPDAFPAGQPGFLFTPLQAVSHSLAESTPTRVMSETTEICPAENSRNTG